MDFALASCYRRRVPNFPLHFNSVENHRFTQSYLQPDEYHFCQDSVLLAHLVAAQLSKYNLRPEQIRALDVCAGCGVLGLELLHHVPTLRALDFMEIQNEFEPFFRANAGAVTRTPLTWLARSYADLNGEDFREQYQLIFGNPPYFQSGEGKLSPSLLRNRCRFYLDADFATLIEGVENALKPEGHAFLLVKSGATHGRNAVREVQLARRHSSTRITIGATIRGTDVLHLQKS